MKGKRKISKITIIFGCLILLFIILLIIAILIPKQGRASSNKKVNEISSPKDFKNVEEAISFTGSTYLSNNGNNIYLKFKYLPYTDDKSNQNYYLRLIKYVAEVRNYKNFNLIDEENKITIHVTCDSNLKQVLDYKINNISNYFGKEDSKIEIKNYSKTNDVSLNIQSDIIKRTINANWQYESIDYGSMESTLDDYKIYFDEGYDIRVIENDHIPTKVFNIVFNSRYKGNIINNLNTNSTFEEIKNILGYPTFDDGNDLLIGYKSNDIYVFFVKKLEGIDVSIYNVESYNTDDFAKFVTNFINNKDYDKLIDSIFSIWSDPSKYTSSQNDFINLCYNNKGVNIEFNTSNPSGVTIYKNFKGKITNDISFEDIVTGNKELPENVYFKNEDSIFIEEKERRTRYFVDDNYEESNELFYVIPSYVTENNIRILTFFSKDGNNPNFQINENVYKTLWADSTHFIYSVSGKGIYMIDVITRKTTTLVNGTWSYNLQGYKDGVLTYDGINININF